jgi:hypothetical protein
MNEYLVCRMFADSRVERINGGAKSMAAPNRWGHQIDGGTNEIVQELISRAL